MLDLFDLSPWRKLTYDGLLGHVGR
jgi:hypothetical protein